MYLDVKTDFTFLNAYGSPDQVVARALELGHTWCGIADTGGTWGHIPFATACKGKLRPIFGVQLAVTVEIKPKDATYDLVTFLAINDEGLREQYELVSLATSQFYYRPRLTWAQVKVAKSQVVIVNRTTPASHKTFHKVKGLYIGVGLDPGYTASLARSMPSVLSLAPHYPCPGDAEAYRLMCAIGSGQRTASVQTTGRYMMGRGELDVTLNDIGVDAEPLIGAAEEIANRCNAKPSMGKNVKPKMDITVERWCERDAVGRGIGLTVEPYKSRYEREIALIHEKGFDDYFLMIADIIADRQRDRWSRISWG
jgi:DNA polymerase-3 subunit alpha